MTLKRPRTLAEWLMIAVALVVGAVAVGWRFIWPWTSPKTDFILFVIMGIGVIVIALFIASRGR